MGYIGYSRSERSERAIDNYEIPLSMFTKKIIDEFIDEFYEGENEEKIKTLKSIPVAVLKYVAKYEVGRSSWHHTSVVYNETDHYSLEDTLTYIFDFGIDDMKSIYKNFKARQLKEKEEEQKEYEYVKIKVAIFGRKGNGFKYLYDITEIGIMVGKWIYYYETNEMKKIRKYSRYSKPVSFENYANSYKEFVKLNKEYKGKSKMFNKLIKDLKSKGTIKGE